MSICKQLVLLILIVTIVACESQFAPEGVQEQVIVPAAIISIEQTGAQAAIDIKWPQGVGDNSKLRLLAASGNEISLAAGASEGVSKFSVKTFFVQNLTPGQQYTVTLDYTDTENNPVSLSRAFTFVPTNYWNKLPHAPVSAGDFTGAALVSPAFGNQLGVYRYQNETAWDILKFNGQWESSASNIPVPRHNAIAFPLSDHGGRELIFIGFGYLNNERIPGQKAYLSDIWWTGSFFFIGQSAGIVFPTYSGIDAEVKYFLSDEKIFMLKENSTGAMRSMEVTWDQKECAPLPEATGNIAAFAIGGTGYVLNQQGSGVPHLFAYSVKDNKWTRKSDFSGPAREGGMGFAANGKGFFGLGINADGKGLRDLWQYDAASDQWKYHSEYPGEGNRFLISGSTGGKVYLGWGYETRALNGSNAIQQIGCTDFWEFNP